MLYVHFSNRYELLAQQLLERLGGTRQDVFAREQVVVPSAAVQRQLTLALADRHGVCANVEFVYLARWLWRQVARVVPGVAAESPFDPAALAWRVYCAFGDAAFVAAHPRLAAYLHAAGADDLMRYELASRTAALLEQYVTYRSDWLAQWQHGGTTGTPRDEHEDEHWQAALWQRIARELALRPDNPLILLARELDRGGAKRVHEAGLPACVHVFGLAAMPPLHMQALQALARWIDVHLYVLNPCREYWFEVVDPRRLSHLAARGRDQGHETGNRLLAAWGGQAQSHIDLLVDICDGAQDDARFEPGAEGTLLAQVQNAILELRELEPGSVAMEEGDRSVEVHVCHSLTRELEALHDHLLGLFADDPSLRPADVLVVTPDLEAAAPLIEAVFGTVPSRRRLPFAITGRARSTVNVPARLLLELLSLASSRAPATVVHGLLQQPPVARRFDLDEADLEQVHGWIADAGIRWGLDAEHVAGLGLPAGGHHSFAQGLDRLFLGYALPAAAGEPLAGILPCGGAQGSSALALGGFWRFVQALQALRCELGREHTPEEWAASLRRVLDTFVDAADGELDELAELHAAIAQLAQAMHAGGLAAPVAAGVVQRALRDLLDDPARGGVPGGAVTFASIASLRSLPYGVICAIALDDGAFPTPDRPAEYDLMAWRPRRGDRQRRADQRNLFLDLLLAARRCLYLSYTGRSIRDNGTLPPSVLVAELLDVLVPAIAADPADAGALAQARARLVVEHPLQPFSPAAFQVDGPPRLRSFDDELAQALRASLQAPPPAQAAGAAAGESEGDEEAQVREPSPPFFSGPLATPGAEWREVSAAQLVRFFRNPADYLLRQRMGITLPRPEDELEDDEPFLPDFPGRAALARRLLPLLLAPVPPAPQAIRRLAEAGSELPYGPVGQLVLEQELEGLGRFAAQVRAASAAPLLPPHHASVELDVDGERWRVQAGLADLRAPGLVRWRYDEERAGDLLEAWIHHLVLCADAPAGVEPVTRWLSCNQERRLRPRQDGRDLLARLLRLYRRGLAAPLPFFPKAAMSYVANDESMFAAERVFRVTSNTPHGEFGHAAYQLAFRGAPDPLAGEFAELAMAVFAPVLLDAGEGDAP